MDDDALFRMSLQRRIRRSSPGKIYVMKQKKKKITADVEEEKRESKNSKPRAGASRGLLE